MKNSFKIWLSFLFVGFIFSFCSCSSGNSSSDSEVPEEIVRLFELTKLPVQDITMDDFDFMVQSACNMADFNKDTINKSDSKEEYLQNEDVKFFIVVMSKVGEYEAYCIENNIEIPEIINKQLEDFEEKLHDIDFKIEY